MPRIRSQSTDGSVTSGRAEEERPVNTPVRGLSRGTPARAGLMQENGAQDPGITMRITQAEGVFLDSYVLEAGIILSAGILLGSAISG